MLLHNDIVIFCIEPNQHLTLLSTGEGVNSINLTWSDQQLASVPLADMMQVFKLNISHGFKSNIISVNESYYYFTAPEDAPPCEVYNFSVTATYIGSTYNGCHVSSPVLSTMLPSLPNINKMEPSINYSLKKEGKEKIILSLSFKVQYEYS